MIYFKSGLEYEQPIHLKVRKLKASYLTPQTLERLTANPNAAAKLFHELKQIETKLADLQPKAEYHNSLVQK